MMTSLLIWWLFWISFGLIIYSYIGFPLLVVLRGLLHPRSIKPGRSAMPTVSVIFAVYNEARAIKYKLINTLALNYPRDRFEIIIASDGSTDSTSELVADYNLPVVKLLQLPRQGKNSALNAAVATAQGDILVFTNVDSILAPDALCHLVAPFGAPEVGGVAGDYRYDTDVTAEADERAYWKFERALKVWQSQADSITSVWEPIYAIRRELFRPIPEGVAEAYFTSAQVLAAHRRLIFEPRAVAVDSAAKPARGEFRRKVWTITARLRSAWKMRCLLNPFEYGFLAIQVFSCKLLRRLVVIPLLLLIITAPCLWSLGWFYQLVTAGQFVFHGAAALGFLLLGTRLGRQNVLRFPFLFDMVYTATAAALFNLLAGVWYNVWTTLPALIQPGFQAIGLANPAQEPLLIPIAQPGQLTETLAGSSSSSPPQEKFVEKPTGHIVATR